MPAIILYSISILIDIVHIGFGTIDRKYIALIINKLIYASGVSVQIGKETIEGIGILWFLFVLFASKMFFDYLYLKFSRKIMICIICTCSLVGVFLGHFQWLPFSFDITLAAIPFLYIGFIFKKIDINKHVYIYGICSLFIWGIILFICYFVKYEYLELAERRYPLYPLCYIGAVSGTIFVSCFSMYISKLKYIKVIKYIGQNSIFLLWIHSMDYLLMSVYSCTKNNLINALIRVILNVSIFFIFMKVKEKVKMINLCCKR